MPSSEVHSLKLIRYVTAWDYFILGMEIIFIGFIIFYTAEEIREILYFKWRYLTKFWNYIDITIVTVMTRALTFTSINKYLYFSLLMRAWF